MANDKNIDVSTASLLQGILGKEIVALIKPKSGAYLDKKTGRYEALAFGIATSEGQRIFIFTRLVDLPDNTDCFVLEVSNSFELRNYPEGPTVDWESIADAFQSVVGCRINSVSTFASSYGTKVFVDDGIEMNLTSGKKLFFSASSEHPSWVELNSGTSLTFSAKAMKRKIFRREWRM
jgi:hypothetical protein